MSEASDLDIAILACIPRDLSRFSPELLADMPKPTHLYSLIQCDNQRCGQDMWIGPRQLDEVRRREQGGGRVVKLCYVCAKLVQHVREAIGNETPVVNLGGGASVEGVVRA